MSFDTEDEMRETEEALWIENNSQRDPIYRAVNRVKCDLFDTAFRLVALERYVDGLAKDGLGFTADEVVRQAMRDGR